jgi:trigger factor
MDSGRSAIAARRTLLKVTKEKTGSCEYTVNAEVEPERVQAPLRQAAQRLSKRRPLPGYRPGKAPYAMVERLLGKEVIMQEMLDGIGDELYEEAIRESGLEPYAVAHMEMPQMDPLHLKFVVPVQPEVKLGDYHTIHVEQKPVEVTQAEVDEVVESIRDVSAVWVPAERAARLGDQVLFDGAGTKDDGGKTEQKDLSVELREDMVPREFGQNLIGMNPGESKEFDVQYPADFGDTELAGKHVRFQVTLKSVKEKELPALTDELAKSAGPYESLAQLREKVEASLREKKKSQAKDEALTQALDALVEQATLEYPAVAVERETQRMAESFSNRLQQQGFTLQGYLDMMKKTPAQYLDELRPQAEKRLRRTLALVQFAEAESVKVEPGEVEQEVERLSQPYGDKAAQVKQLFGAGEPLRSVQSEVYSRKAQTRLLAMATGQVEVMEKPEDSTDTRDA